MWNPESGDPLPTAAVNVMNLEESCMRLFHAFLEGYFNGAAHTVNGESVDFPLAALGFQQALVPQPLNGLAINLVTISGGQAVTKWKPGGREAFNRACWEFFIRAQVTSPRPDGHNAESLTRLGAGRLYLLFMHRLLLLPLSNKGIAHLRPSMPKAIMSTDYPLRSITLKGMLHFPVF